MSHIHVRSTLRDMFRDFNERKTALNDISLEEIARLVAWFHHRFQWIHPFNDTNGRTGRILDLLVIWVTFGLIESSFEESAQILYFPTDRHKTEYYEGLREADGSRGLSRLENYYIERLGETFREYETS
ncbi:MAG: Fic family protein [Deinococcaceae bacterium]